MYSKLCIPKIEKKYNKDEVVKLLNTFNLGKIKDVNLVTSSKDAMNSKTAFIFIEEWYANDKVKAIFERFNGGKDIKLVATPPLYWKVVVAK